MPSLIDIRRRVRAVKSTQQITKAMKMVSSSKLRRAQERIVKSRPYAKEMLRVFNNLATRTENAAHPLLNDDPESGRTLLIVITADRGLCGSFNTNVAKAALQFTLQQPKDDKGRDVAMALVGRKGRDFFMRRGFDVLYEEVGLFQNVKWTHAQQIAARLVDRDRIRRIADCCSYSDRRINGDASVTGYCYNGTKVFCIGYRDTNVRC